jgi:hypothetical protein
MNKIIIKSLLSILFFFFIRTFVGYSQENTRLNLNEFTLNDLPLKDLTIDKVTDILGRPSATNNSPIAPDIVEITGAIIYYHDKGLVFWFAPSKTDALKRLWNIKVFLVRSWDKSFSEFNYPFKGIITPNLNGNMKSDSVFSIFKVYNPELKEAKQARIESDALRKEKKLERYIPQSTISHDRINAKTDKGSIILECEELTKFLEFFTLFPAGNLR